jgi:tyrosyl-tRNA synthetase
MEKFVITVPTLLSADGVNKMSKSIGQCIFLTDSSQDKYGKIMALPDNLIIHFYNLSTNLLDEEIKDIENKLNNATVDPMEAKKDLAYEIVKTLNGGEQANSAKNFFEKTIQEGQAPDDTPQVSKMELVSSITNKPIIKDLLIYLKLYTSSSEAKRQILAGAVEIDGKKVLDFNQAIDINSIEYIKAGKRNWIKLIN